MRDIVTGSQIAVKGLKIVVRKDVRVRLPPSAPFFFSVVYRHAQILSPIELEVDNGYLVRCVVHSEVRVKRESPCLITN